MRSPGQQDAANAVLIGLVTPDAAIGQERPGGLRQVSCPQSVAGLAHLVRLCWPPRQCSKGASISRLAQRSLADPEARSQSARKGLGARG